MASRIISLPNGTKGAVDPALFQADPGNTLGSLAQPYATVALGFTYTAAAGWAIQRSDVTVGNGGDGDTDEDTGFSGSQTQSDTSLLKNGFFSSKASFTVQGHAVSPVSLPYTVSMGASPSYLVARTGISANNCVGIAGDLIKGALHASYWELYQQSRKCYTLLGLTAELPAGFGLASQEDVTNGTLGCGQQVQYRRPTVIPPGNTNTPEYLWRCTFGHSIAVAADPSFDAPADGVDVAIKCQVFFQGYFSDENGIPLVMTGMVDGSEQVTDPYEALRANNVTI